jgi:hypothetical protein
MHRRFLKGLGAKRPERLATMMLSPQRPGRTLE